MGNNLGKLRKSRRWTQDEASERFGMSTSGYRKLEYGERELKASDIEKAADVYGVSVSEVLNRNTVRVVGRVDEVLLQRGRVGRGERQRIGVGGRDLGLEQVVDEAQRELA